MRKIESVLAGLALVTVSGMAMAAGGPEPLKPDPGVIARVEKLNHDIAWHRSLDQALAEGCNQGRMVLWIEMAGRLDGAT